MAIANLQYAWTLFTKPMQAHLHVILTAIQGIFSLFILVSTRMKRLKIPWIAVRVTCRWACIGLVKRVQAYCRFAIAIDRKSVVEGKSVDPDCRHVRV